MMDASDDDDDDVAVDVDGAVSVDGRGDNNLPQEETLIRFIHLCYGNKNPLTNQFLDTNQKK